MSPATLLPADPKVTLAIYVSNDGFCSLEKAYDLEQNRQVLQRVLNFSGHQNHKYFQSNMQRYQSTGRPRKASCGTHTTTSYPLSRGTQVALSGPEWHRPLVTYTCYSGPCYIQGWNGSREKKHSVTRAQKARVLLRLGHCSPTHPLPPTLFQGLLHAFLPP